MGKAKQADYDLVKDNPELKTHLFRVLVQLGDQLARIESTKSQFVNLIRLASIGLLSYSLYNLSKMQDTETIEGLNNILSSIVSVFLLGSYSVFSDSAVFKVGVLLASAVQLSIWALSSFIFLNSVEKDSIPQYFHRFLERPMDFPSGSMIHLVASTAFFYLDRSFRRTKENFDGVKSAYDKIKMGDSTNSSELNVDNETTSSEEK